MVRVAMLSRWHVHADEYANELKSMDNVEITYVWDEIKERGAQWAVELGATFEANLDSLLMRDDVDAVAICSPTSMHKEIMVAAAEAGKHIFTEKVMAPTVKECEEISRAVKKAGVKFCISLPHRTFPANLFAKKIVQEKIIGDITFLRARVAHDGALANWLPDHFYDPELCGGGAMIDLGTHPMYLSRWILGKPQRITSMFNSYTNRAVEDNAVCIIEYENKAIAVVETGFVSPDSPASLEIYGTKGSLVIGGTENKVRLISKNIETPVQGWITPSTLPEALPRAAVQWIKGITEGAEIFFGLEEGMQLTELMEAAYVSHRERREVKI
ncbi:MAG TPA: Gfo/Idh/MocA family oxidoreductase [Ruminiclostridium sp.]